MTKRVVVTGLGIVSSLGNNAEEVTSSLKQGKSGISYNAAQEEIGMRSWVSGKPDIDLPSTSIASNGALWATLRAMHF